MTTKTIEEIDSNFKKETINGIDLEFHEIQKAPFKITGFPWLSEERVYCRLPQKIIPETNPGVQNLAWHTSGGMIRFKTNSPTIALNAKLHYASQLTHMAHAGVAGFDLYLGQGSSKQFFGNTKPEHARENIEGILIKGLNAGLLDCTIYFPLYSGVDSIQIGLVPGCKLEEPSPLTYEKPVLFYGSSITQGGCASRPGTAYTHILTRKLDTNFINWGFSGSGKGEPIMAETIASLDLSCFIFDYDHNAPTPEYLAETHEPFFNIIRQKHPELPIVMVSKPDFYGSAGDKKRREIIKSTYNNALKKEDKNVYFIDGELLFGETDRDNCTVDRCHPNDIGFLRMAEMMYPVIKQILS